MRRFVSILALLLFATVAISKIVTQAVEYKDGDQIFKGYVAYDDSLKAPAPGILIIHEWWGLTDYPKNRAKQLAELGYVAFCADIYGDGKTTDSWEEAPKLAGQFWSDHALFRARETLALEQLKMQPHVDKEKLAAIGYCFGGLGVLCYARGGAELDGVVAFHGGFAPTTLEEAKNIKCKVLLCHGADDPFEQNTDAFKAQLDSAGVHYKFVAYPGAVHAFTNPAANAKDKGVAYNAVADKRSWEEMKKFFAEIFK